MSLSTHSLPVMPEGAKERKHASSTKRCQIDCTIKRWGALQLPPSSSLPGVGKYAGETGKGEKRLTSSIEQFEGSSKVMSRKSAHKQAWLHLPSCSATTG